MNPAENYIFNQPEPYRSILMHLQVIVEHTVPYAELKYKWRIPVYYIKGRPLCYFNASHKKDYVDVGFWKGKSIKVHNKHFITEKRKLIVSLRYVSLETIDDTIFIEVLKEAVGLY